MSAVRKCDLQRAIDCHDIFSELSDGWQSFTGTTTRRDPETKQMVNVTQVLDACPACAVLPEPEKHSAAQQRQELESREAAISRKERELGIWDPLKNTEAEMQDAATRGTE